MKRGLLGIAAAMTLAAAAQTAPAAVMISDFEDGTLQGWQSSSCTLSVETIDANKWMKVTVASSAEWWAQMSNHIDRNPVVTTTNLNANPTLEFDLYIPNPFNNSMQCTVGLVSDVKGWGQTATVPLDTATQYTVLHRSVDYSSLLPRPADPNWAELSLCWATGWYPDGESRTFYIDNIQMTPEPGSLGVLAVGSLLALRRRR